MSSSAADLYRLYFLAIVPPSPLYEEALALKNHFKDHYNSKASLNSPPHITLHMPFRWREDREFDLVRRLMNFTFPVRPFRLQLENFGAFPPRVIFIDVQHSEPLFTLQQELLRYCKRELNLFNANYKDQPFHPHVTLAFRDLKKSLFAQAWDEFQSREFSGNFQVSEIQLLKHNGKTWDTFQQIPFE